MKSPQEKENHLLKPEYYALEVIDRSGGSQVFRLRQGIGLAALKAKSSPIEFDCLEADCGICVVRVLKHPEHLSAPNERERDFLKAMHADPEERLACQCRLLGDVSVKVEY